MTSKDAISEVLEKSYPYGFLTDIEYEKVPKGINEDIVRLISKKKKRTKVFIRFSVKSISSVEANERA